ncbi:MAG: FxsA family protein [Gammaproteobacteria bacterium]|nr:MAG: FxsA family protein [Gammaproteobacteria bacterium]
MPLLYLAFLLVPLIEIYVLIQVGSVIGALPTVILVVLTAVIGVTLLRRQGLRTWMRAQEQLARGMMPAAELLEGMMLMLAGAFLLTPGFVTDTLGFLLLVPAVRRLLIQRMMTSGRWQTGAGSFRDDAGTPPFTGGGQGRVIEGEFSRCDDDRQADDAARRHDGD